MSYIDLNCDLGEGCDFDRDLMPLITSANIACGFHAGDPATAFTALNNAVEQGVTIGAHPGFPDKENFGRRELLRTEDEIYQDCVYQIGALSALAKAAGGAVKYIKAHGALYNMACRDAAYARPIIAAAVFVHLPLLGLPDSQLQSLSEGRCHFVAEGFADRRYLPDGSLVPRTEANAFVENVDEAVEQAEWLIREKGVETLCVHGDNPQALVFVNSLRSALEKKNFTIQAFA